MIIEALMYMIKVKVSIYSAFRFISHLYRLCIYLRFYDIDGITIFSSYGVQSMNFFFVSVHSASYE